MSLLVQLLAQALPAPVPVVPVERSPKSETRPLLTATCDIVERGKPWQRIVLRTEGGLGYRSKIGTVSSTPRKWLVVSDAAKVFEGFAAGKWEPTEVWFAKNPDQFIVMRGEFVSRGESSLGDISSVTIAKGPLDRTINQIRYVGFCDLSAQTQEPLSEAETREHK